MTHPSSRSSLSPTSGRRQSLIGLLFLLLIFVCVLGASQSALWFVGRSQIYGTMNTNHQADYSPGPALRLNPLDRDRMLVAIMQDEIDLQATPELTLAGVPLVAALPEPSPPFPTPDLPTPPPSFTPHPTATPTSPPTPTSLPTRTPAKPTAVNAAPSATSLPLSPTPLPPSTPTSGPTVSPTPPPAPVPSEPPSTPTPAKSTPKPTTEPKATNTPEPDRPPQLADDTAITTEDTPLSVNVLANDRDVLPATLLIVSPPTHGSTSLNPIRGEINYTPVANYFGSDSLIYQVCNVANSCAQAAVYLTVTPVNDPPLLADDSGFTADDLPLVIDVLANDSDVEGELDPASVAVITAPVSGTVVINPASGQITYMPNLQADGLDSFVYTACDTAAPTPACNTAIVRVEVSAVPKVPLTLRAAPGDSQVSLGWTSALGLGAQDYQLYRDAALVATTTVTDYLDTGLTNGITYSYTIRALNGAGRVIGLSNLALARPYSISVPYSSTLDCQGAVLNCASAEGGPPDGDFAQIPPGALIIFDFGETTGLINGPGYDLVLYDRESPQGSGEIQIDLQIIEVSADGLDWYTVFAWDGQPGGVQGTNVDRHATVGPGEPDGEVDDEVILVTELYNNTGIAIDLAPWVPPGLAFPLVRLSHPDPNGQNPVDVDAIERLN